MDARRRRAGWDPRLGQIATLGALLVYGSTALAFEIEPGQVAAVLATVLATQWMAQRWKGVPGFDPRSPLISGLSLCLLLRASAWPWAVATAVVAIASKFVLRVRGKHVFNPTNFGLVAMIGASDQVWVSPGQWGSLALFAFGVACAGVLVVSRASRADLTVAFLACHAILLFGRALWLGDPWTIPLHQLQSGALLVFAFFMISDPKTTPNSRRGRLVYAALVAGLAGAIRFGLHEPNALLWALVACAPAVPLLDRLLPGPAYAWPGTPDPTPASKGDPHAFPTHAQLPAGTRVLPARP